MCNVKHNAFLSICKACNDEIRPIDRKDLSAIRVVMDRHAAKAILLGFSKVAMMYQIGVINGVLKERV
ncbi:hypothetical protein NVP2095A_64 [Vibrio phage 2.095.A._10N.286.46.E10]|nr:hypothetical protein NVP2095A_64 [Vibrio phage 2.095.A._10N.286.46.E10]AUS02222.1 hypothetical protein NVP2095B_64 [Vibrio phage 2.095.B._10N.286.46.E10]